MTGALGAGAYLVFDSATTGDPEPTADARASPTGPAESTTETTDPATTAPETTAATAPETTTTVPPETTTTTAPPPPEPRFQRGDEGEEVRAIQQRLVDLGYWLPETDGTYGYLTSQAVMAFQKYEGISRDGITGPQTLAALEVAGPVTPRDPAGHHVEIDLERQVLFLVTEGGSLAFNTSTGRSGWRTPPGNFTITREIDGMRRAPLGDLWRPKYFNGGIAIHGSGSVPGYPASHGCTRLSNPAMDFLWEFDLLPRGTPVWVY